MMKYIMFKIGDMDTPIIFPNHIQYVRISGCFGLRPKDITSAGFISEDDKGVVCFGGSYTLDIESRPEDTQIIKDYLC